MIYKYIPFLSYGDKTSVSYVSLESDLSTFVVIVIKLNPWIEDQLTH